VPGPAEGTRDPLVRPAGLNNPAAVSPTGADPELPNPALAKPVPVDAVPSSPLLEGSGRAEQEPIGATIPRGNSASGSWKANHEPANRESANHEPANHEPGARAQPARESRGAASRAKPGAHPAAKKAAEPKKSSEPKKPAEPKAAVDNEVDFGI
jgi:hypothetical protein